MKVSCIMPTRNRRHLAPLAIRAYLAQDWPRRELVVVDDGDDAVADLFENVPDCLYMRVAGPQRIGAKRNLACEAARGEIIVHWDDDDWSCPCRITDQVVALALAGKPVTGYHSLLFWNEAKREASKYYGAAPRGAGLDYALGSTLCYRRSYWEAHRFPNQSVGEDNEFERPARDAHELVAWDAGRKMVARIHGANTSERTGPLQWPRVEVTEIPPEFFADVAAAKAAGAP